MSIKAFLNNSEFRTGIDDKSFIRPISFSLTIGLSYIILISLYIWLSGKYAAQIASSLKNLEQMELIKGLVFAVVTGSCLFISLLLIFLKIKKKDEIIIAQNKSIISSEGLVLSGLFSSSISHDIRNLLTIIIGNSELLMLSGHLTPVENKYVNEIKLATQNLNNLSQRLMDASKGRITDDKEITDLSLVIKDTINFANVHNKIKPCTLHHELPEELEMNLNPLLFSRTLTQVRQ
jgi:signal transduction histidine kinase